MASEEASAMTDGNSMIDDRRYLLKLTVASAIVVAVFFQSKTIAYNNYNLWRFTVMGIECGVALVGSFAANLVRGMDERGEAWAASYVTSRKGWFYHLLSLLPAAAVRGALITALVSIPNATFIPLTIYREDIGNPVIAVITRFLADIPLAIVLCVVTKLVLDGYLARKAAKQA